MINEKWHSLKETLALLLVTLLCAGSAAHAATVTLDAVDRGWYDANGIHAPFNLNYVTADGFGPIQNGITADNRNFFVFDLGAIQGNIVSATLHVFNPGDDPATSPEIEMGFESSGATGNYELRDVMTPIAILVAGGTNIATFADLGDGAFYGAYTASNTDNGSFIDIVLRTAAIADMNAARGGSFALGGQLTLGATEQGVLFAFSNSGALSDTQLVLNVAAVPEPSTYAMLLAGLGVLGFIVRRKNAA